MKCCMVACINILYWGNMSALAAADGSAVLCFLRVSDHLESIGKNFFFTENFDYQNFRDDVIHREIFLSSGGQNFSGLKRVKNTKPPTRPPTPTDFPSRVC